MIVLKRLEALPRSTNPLQSNGLDASTDSRLCWADVPKVIFSYVASHV